MTWFVEVGLSNACAAAVLAIIALVVGLLCRRPAVIHALWLLVLLKLLTPPLVRVPLPTLIGDRQETANHALSDLEAALLEEVAEGDIGEAEDLIELPTDREERVVGAFGTHDGEEIQTAAVPFSWLSLMGGVWLVGASLWFALACLRLWRFGRLLRLGRPAPRPLLDRIAQLARRVGLAAPAVRLIPGRLPPMIWGVGSPLLLLPEGLEEQVGEEGLDTLLMHELSHLRRGDHLVRWLEFFALGMYWWLPVTWLARRELREAEEQCCDAWVVRTLPGSEKLYATALVEALEFLSQPTTAVPPLASALGQVADLKRRLTMIMRGTTPHLLGRPAGVAVFGLAVFLLPLVPGLGLGQEARRDERKDTIRFVEPDVKKLHDEIRRKKEELDLLHKKLEQVSRAPVDRGRKQPEGGRERPGESARDRKGPGPVGAVLRIEISGGSLKTDDLNALAAKIKEIVPGKDLRVTIHREGEAPRPHGKAIIFDRHSKRTEPESREPKVIPFRRGDPGAPTPPAPPRPPMAMTPKGAPWMPPPNRGEGDRRIDGLEKKLDSVLKELESMRKEMRAPGQNKDRPGGGEGGGSRGGPPRRGDRESGPKVPPSPREGSATPLNRHG